MDYSDFLIHKKNKIMNVGFEPTELHKSLFDFQVALTKWSVRKGKSALWCGTGTGKTRMQLAWADQIYQHTGKPVLILAPLAVSEQTILEGKKINIEINHYGSGNIQINNYEQIHNMDCSKFVGIVLDESSCLKSFSSKHKMQIIDTFRTTPYKLCCSATPSPNDFTEIGNHAEHLNICSRAEMLATYFVHDSGETQKWRLKGHAEKAFFEWLSTWAVMMSNPSDLGYSDDGYNLPELIYHQHIVKSKVSFGSLFHDMASTLDERRKARKESLLDRCTIASELSKGSDKPWIYWCDLNDESKTILKMVDDIVEVDGTLKNEVKASRMIGFSNGDFKKLVIKVRMAQFGLNWQHCNNMVFVGLSDSFEALYQAIRRCWRFGQKEPVNVHIVISEKEGNVLQNIRDKESKAEEMKKQMIACMSDLSKFEINNSGKNNIEYKPQHKMRLPLWIS